MPSMKKPLASREKSRRRGRRTPSHPVAWYDARQMIKRPKIAIIGAGGNVGAAVAQWAVTKELGDLVLVDVKPGPAEGRALDLTQAGAWEGFNNTNFVATDKIEAIAGADVVVMTA